MGSRLSVGEKEFREVLLYDICGTGQLIPEFCMKINEKLG